MTTRQIIEGRGYMPQYRLGERNHCPGCSRTHWLVGRMLAECAFCDTALPIAGASPFGQYEAAA
jgi:hypothetical protein